MNPTARDSSAIGIYFVLIARAFFQRSTLSGTVRS
jgi:hypothetical protein